MLHLSADRLHPRLPKYFDPRGRGVHVLTAPRPP
jgi:hypothetical protein